MAMEIASLPPMPIALFRNRRDIHPVAKLIAWPDFVGSFSTHRRVLEKDGEAFSLVSYKAGETRRTDGVEAVYAAVADIDSGLSVEDFLKTFPHDLEVFIASSFSSTPEHPKYRAITPLSHPVPANDWPEMWQRLQWHVWHGASDKATKDPSRLFYGPACPPDAEPFVHHRPGLALDWTTLPPVPEMPAPDLPVERPDIERHGAPGDDFNERADWHDILEPHNWAAVATIGEETRWRRPGKTDGISATTNYNSSDLFWVFSSNASPFEEGHSYTKFGAYTLLEHGGNYRAAAAALAELGYGDPQRHSATSVEVTAPKPLVRLLTASEMKCLRPPEPLIENVLFRDSIAVEDGPPGTFKSFIALDMALSVATGLPWHGHAVHQGPVVYVSAEGSAGMVLRIQAWEIARKVIAPDWCRFVPDVVNFLDPHAVSALRDAIESLPEPPVLIVVDTLARAMAGGDENSSKDMGLAIGAMDALRRSTGATVLALHHVNRGAGEIRGHSSLRGALDTELKTSTKTGIMVTISCEKQKDAEPFKPITLLTYAVPLPEGRTSLALTRDGTDAMALSADQDQVMGLLRDCFGIAGATSTEWKTVCVEHRISDSTFYRAKRRLTESGRVVTVDGKEGRGAKFRPSDLLSVAVSPGSVADSNFVTPSMLTASLRSRDDSNSVLADQERTRRTCQRVRNLSSSPDSLGSLAVSQGVTPVGGYPDSKPDAPSTRAHGNNESASSAPSGGDDRADAAESAHTEADENDEWRRYAVRAIEQTAAG